MKNWLSKLAGLMLIASALWLAPVTAMADAPDVAQVEGYMNSIMNKPFSADDMAHKSLVRLFGGFIFEPFGGGPADPPTALAQVLGYTNVIAMILGVIIMAYVILAGALNTAASGEMLGKSWSSVWLPLRTSFAFGMIMPASSGGETFSVAQSLVIWMIIVGSNSATWLWEKGIETLGTGTPVFSTVNYHDTNGSAKIIDAVMCTAARAKLLEKKDKVSDPVIGGIRSIDEQHLTTPIKYSQLGTASLSTAKVITLDNCGAITFPNSKDLLSGTNMEESGRAMFLKKSTEWEANLQKKFNESARKNANTFILAAKNYSNHVINQKLDKKAIESAATVGAEEAANIKLKINTAALEYGKAVAAYETYLQAVTNETLQAAKSGNQSWSENMTKGGWMRAGAVFFETSRLQGFVQTLLASVNSGSSANESPSLDGGCTVSRLWSNCAEQGEELNSLIKGHGLIKNEAAAMGSDSQGLTSTGGMKLTKNALLNEGSEVTMDEAAIDSVSSAMSSVFLNAIMGLGEDDAQGTGGNHSTNGGTNNNMATNVSGMISPFTAVSSIGRGLQQIGVAIWTAGLIASGLLGAMAGAGETTLGQLSGATVVTSGLVGAGKYILGSLAPILAGVGALAFMLAFSIPFMPVAVWIMLVCGYLVTVIEAVAAAPLAVIMLATPEGEGISGTNFTKALQMINAIILRPSLSIVGLFAAMTLSYVGFSILNELFWTVAGLTTNFSIFETMAIIFIYASLAFKVCEYMISVIHKIPDHIMEWMGGGMTRPFGEDAAGGDMTQALKSNAAASGISGIAGMKTAGGIIGDRINKQRQAQSREMEAKRHQELMDAQNRT
jgi:conjugal transfer/type IV secretion protein DotA/TraY